MNKPNPTKQDVKESFKERIEKYRTQRKELRKFLEDHPDEPERKKEFDQHKVGMMIDDLQGFYDEIIPHARYAKKHVPDVLGQDRLSAAYLLIGKSLQGMSASLLLARKGFNYQVMELTRSGRESMDLASKFLASKNDDRDVKNWFAGKVIGNSLSRDSLHEFVNDSGLGDDLPVASMKAGIYGGLSNYTHSTYMALLDSYDVFKDDFDFDLQAGLHLVAETAAPYLLTELAGVAITLKHFFIEVGDQSAFDAVDEILTRLTQLLPGNPSKAKEVVDRHRQ